MSISKIHALIKIKAALSGKLNLPSIFPHPSRFVRPRSAFAAKRSCCCSTRLIPPSISITSTLAVRLIFFELQRSAHQGLATPPPLITSNKAATAADIFNQVPPPAALLLRPVIYYSLNLTFILKYYNFLIFSFLYFFNNMYSFSLCAYEILN